MSKRASVERTGTPSTRWLWTCAWSREHRRYELRATRAARGARTLRQYLAAEPHPGDHAAFSRLFEVIRKMHRGGLFHGALTPENIIVATSSDGDWEEFYVSESPRSMLFPRDISGTRMAERDLLELTRALVRVLRFPSNRIPLEAYGLDGFECAELVSRVYYGRRSPLHDWIVRGEFRARCLAARAAAALGLRLAARGRTEVC